MPQFIMPLADDEQVINYSRLTSLAQGYVEALFFTDCNSDSDDELGEMTFGDLTDEGLAAIKRDCTAFWEKAVDILSDEPADDQQAGRDFWYTRQGHGTGFWCRGDNEYSPEAREKLDKIARTFGEVWDIHSYF